MRNLFLLFALLSFSSYLFVSGCEYEYEAEADDHTDYDDDDYDDDDEYDDDISSDYHDQLTVCARVKLTRSEPFSLNYLGQILSVRRFDDYDDSDFDDDDDSGLDESGLVFCPGDTFGDLNDTYVTVKNCYLAMYHQDKMIWSSKLHHLDTPFDDELICAFFLKNNGEIALIKESNYPDPKRLIRNGNELWSSQTFYYPKKTELRIQDRQLQIVHTLRDGTQRVFYLDANSSKFREDLGEPVKIAEKYLLKNHSDQENTLLRRNQYIGDLNGTYLILQTNCELELVNKNSIIWSFLLPSNHNMDCVLKTEKDGQITLSEIPEYWKQSIINEPNGYSDLQVISSQITIEDDKLLVIQTLNNGSELAFYTGPGRQTALKIKKEPRQIAENAITISKDGLKGISIEIMDYIGDLNNLHLILEQNCSLILANGSQKLWEYQGRDYRTVMNCTIHLNSKGYFYFTKFWYYSYFEQIVDLDIAEGAEYKLKLEDNQVIITHQHSDRVLDFFHAGSNTPGVLFRRISERSIVINNNDSDRNLPKLGYIGDLNGVYVIFEHNCNWVLYNKTQVIWESGIYSRDHYNHCSLALKRDGAVDLFNDWWKPAVWSTRNVTSETELEKELMQTELRVDDDGLWLINTFHHETVIKYKAKEGTNNFSMVREKEKLVISLDL